MDCYNDCNCKSANIVYWFECNLHKPRMCCHPSAGHGIIINANDIVYKHFNQPAHLIWSFQSLYLKEYNLGPTIQTKQHLSVDKRESILDKKPYWELQHGMVVS